MVWSENWGLVQELQRMERSMAWKVACNEGAIGQNDMKEFDVDGVTVLLARVGEEYFAYPPLCPHQEEPLRKGLCDSEWITCFKHIWQWDLRTGHLRRDQVAHSAEDVPGEESGWTGGGLHRAASGLRLRMLTGRRGSDRPSSRSSTGSVPSHELEAALREARGPG